MATTETKTLVENPVLHQGKPGLEPATVKIQGVWHAIKTALNKESPPED